MPTASIASTPTPASARASAAACSTLAHSSHGSCSTHPGRGVARPTGTVARPSTSGGSSTTRQVVPVVPWSTARITEPSSRYSPAVRATVVLVLLAAALAASGVRAAGPAPLGSAVGAYRFADGSTAALVRQGAGLRLVDYRSGALRQLSPRSHDLFVGGPGVSVLQPVRVTVRLVPGRGGASVGLRLGGRSAARLPLVVRAAAFRDGGVRIAGRLLLPAGRGPFPAVVIVPGSSTGRCVRAATDRNLHDLAADARAGVAWLRRQHEIDASRSGLTGGSQAGWI